MGDLGNDGAPHDPGPPTTGTAPETGPRTTLHLAASQEHHRRGGGTRATDERYFWCPVSSAELTRDNLNQYERSYIQEFRWWSIDDPDLLGIRIFPEDFIDAAGRVLCHGRPAAAQWLR